jgi:phosphatidylinositol kinase/protein kinase (PI-3  family)
MVYTTNELPTNISSDVNIVRYLIRLGDHHACNIFVMKNSRSAIHINFSDCFDQARSRPNVPEQVPFRLTKMMVKASGISGVEGVSRMTATFAANVMRRNKTELLGFLDVFAQDIQNKCDSEQSSQVRRKLSGKEFGADVAHPGDDQ